MIVVNLFESQPFTTKDGSEIRSLLDSSNAPVKNQSLAEATLHSGQSTSLHLHPVAEEFYYVTQGKGLMRLGEEKREVGPGDAILIPPGVAHQLTNTGTEMLCVICCCAPPYRDEDTKLL